MKIYETVEDFAVEKPVTFSSLVALACTAVSIPLCVLLYRYLGRTAGKAAAKELLKK